MPFGTPYGGNTGSTIMKKGPAGSVSGQTMNQYLDAVAYNQAGGNGRAMTPSQIAAAVGIPQQYQPGAYTPASTPSSSASGTQMLRYNQPSSVAPSSAYNFNAAANTPSTGTQITSTPQGSVGGNPGNTTGGAQGSGSQTPLPANGTDPVDWRFQGSDQSFSQRDLETMLNDPYTFQKAFLASRGLDTPGANAALGQYAARLNPLSFVLGAANMDPNAQSDIEDLANIYQGLMSNYVTPGGRMPDVGEIMNTLLSTGDIPSGGDPTSLLQSILAGQDPQGQTQAVNQILGAGLAGMPGMWGNAWANMLDQLSSNYLYSTMDSQQGPGATYLSYLRNNPFISQVRG